MRSNAIQTDENKEKVEEANYFYRVHGYYPHGYSTWYHSYYGYYPRYYQAGNEEKTVDNK